MKLFDVCIRAFVKGNLGDDLFIDTLCRRYPNTRFVLCGEQEYKDCFRKLPNLTYVSYDSWWVRLVFRTMKLPVLLFNKISKKMGGKKYVPYFGCEQFLQTVSRRNVLISGSIFMEVPGIPFRMSPYYLGEVKYYKRNPYVIGCNFGPYYNEGYRSFYEERFAEAAQVVFREKHSYELFHGDNIGYGTDILFSYPKQEYKSIKESGYVAISVLDLNKDTTESSERADKYIAAVTALTKELLRRGERVALVGFCKAQGDHLIIDEIYRKCEKNPGITVWNYPEVDYHQMVGVLAEAKSIVSTRYHGMILGWLFGKRVLPLIYSSKMQHVIDDAEINIETYDLLQEEMDAKELIEAYDRMMSGAYDIDIEHLIKCAEVHFARLDQELL